MKYNQIRLINSEVGESGIMVLTRSPSNGISLASVYYVLFITICLLITGCASTSGPAPVVDRTLADSRKVISKSDSASGEKEQYYIVQRGDTLYGIAVSHGISHRALAEWNNIADANTIKPGQKISLSVPSRKIQPTIFALPQHATPSIVETTTVSPDLISEVGAIDNKIKTEPKGIKLPYSEQALAQIQSRPNAAAIIPVNTAASVPVAVANTDSQANKVARIEAAPPPRPQESNARLNDSNIEWIWPTAGEVLEGYSKNSKGVRISGETGQSILASAAGKVVYSGNGLRGYGELVIIKHNDAFLSAYAYNSKILVKEGDAVTKGQKIAEMGNTDTDMTKLHFEIRKHGKPVDPLNYLPEKPR
ncbi:MAG: peptidoglycan DD-metalloendopeptidase family protein [Nitrosomonas sp.]|nr:peptidoglycan DD-metalloendopeptidase family protein [Nitrosomonas sp.]MDP1950075.1 peptidoglycan DD-metalloendopeptidase family protein [Nitrosomonas sp.]